MERRHTVLLADRDIAVLQRAVLAYAALLKIQAATDAREESNGVARAGALVQEHLRCNCGSSQTPEPAPPPEAKKPIPIEDRKVI